MLATTVFACGVLASGTPCTAGAWPQPPGTTLLIIDLQTSSTDREYDQNGKLVARRNYQKVEVAPYLEHGLTDDLTLVGRTSLLKQSSDVPGGTIASTTITEVEAGLRYHAFTISGMLVSIQPGLIYHTALTDDDPYTSKAGDIDKKIAILLGRSSTLLGIPTFTSTESAYIFHDHNRPDEVKTDVTLGFGSGEGTLFMIKSFNSVSVGTSPLTPSHVISSKLGFQLVERVHPLLSIGGGITQTIAGQNTTKETLFGLTLWYHL
ncbi:MAG: hypothetical protein PW790_07765 [Parvibaculaceae bacterium]|nr:hypothetical protein [Parvibaculaceae bacterium]